MSHVAAEMERLGFAAGADGGPPVPLLIGGATTSRAHTAIKIAPNYSGPVVYVPDASRAVGVVTRLLSIDNAADFRVELAADHAKVRAQHANKKGIKLLTLPAVRANRFVWNGDAAYRPTAPKKPGVHVLREIDLATLADYIDWGPFFQTWDLAGSYPKILDDAVVGATARAVFNDARRCWRRSSARSGCVPTPSSACSRPTASVTTSKSMPTKHAAAVDGLAQPAPAAGAAGGQAALLPERFRRRRGTPDWIGAFAVGAGFGIEEKLAEFNAAHDDYHAIMLKAIADRFAEACAEWLHAQVRRDYWGYASDEDLDRAALIREDYRGIRPAPGYPACPDHTAKGALFELLDAPRQPAWRSPSPSPCRRPRRFPASIWHIRKRVISRSARSPGINSQTGRSVPASASPKPSAGWRRCSEPGAGAWARPCPPSCRTSSSATSSLERRTTLALPGQAAFYAEITGGHQLAQLAGSQRAASLRSRVPAATSLLTGDFDGLMLHMAIAGRATARRGRRGLVCARRCRRELASTGQLDAGAGLAGTRKPGADPRHGRRRADPEHRRLRAGSRRSLPLLEAVDMLTGRTIRLDRAACRFAYRDSVFKQEGWHLDARSVITRSPSACRRPGSR
jgi:hypothetical protein